MSAAATLDSLPLLASGKVREMYDLGDRLLMVASDRISTYDVVHPTPIPGKGQVLTGISVFWFDRTAHICRNHVVSYTDVPDEAKGRALLVDRLEMFPVECVARGYLTGSGWKDYLSTGSVCGIELPPGLQETQQLPEPIFTPATKAEMGDHDENIDFARMSEVVGAELAAQIRYVSIRLYRTAAEIALRKGIIIADTKFEFGLDRDGTLTLMDEVLTPDSSRFWPVEGYEAAFHEGRNPPSYDKQFVRDWLEQAEVDGKPWGKAPPAPPLPADVIEKTAAKYREALQRLTA